MQSSKVLLTFAVGVSVALAAISVSVAIAEPRDAAPSATSNASTNASTNGPTDLFLPVYTVMNQDPATMGCLGCHIGPQPGLGPWWMESEDDVLAALQANRALEDGRNGILAMYLHDGTMPLSGQAWGQPELDDLDHWLCCNYEANCADYDCPL